MTVAEGSVPQKMRTLCRQRGNGPQLMISGISLAQSRCLTPAMVASLCEIEARGTEEAQIEMAGLLAERGQLPERVCLLQNATTHIASRLCRPLQSRPQASEAPSASEEALDTCSEEPKVAG